MRPSGLLQQGWLYEVGGKTAMALKLLFTDGGRSKFAALYQIGKWPPVAIAPIQCSGSDEHLCEYSLADWEMAPSAQCVKPLRNLEIKNLSEMTTSAPILLSLNCFR